MPPTLRVEGFSVSRAVILDGSTAADDWVQEDGGDLYGVRNASLAAATGSYDNTGDDSVLSSWFWLENATLTVQGGYIPFDTISELTGDTITSTGSGDSIVYSLPLWSEASVNIGTKPVLIRMLSKDSEGTPRVLDFVLYKVQFSPISFDGPQYKSGLLVNYSGRANVSSTDEEGATLSAGRAVGRMISRAAA